VPPAPHHRHVPVRWSLRRLRQIIGQEIALVTGDPIWALPTAGGPDDFKRVLEAARRWPRAMVWEGPWFLFSEFATLAQWAGRYPTAPGRVQTALREAAWYWRGFGRGRYSTRSAHAVLAFLELEAWPPGWRRVMEALPSFPVRDPPRLERRVRFVTAAVEAAEGRAETRWGAGVIDCRPLLAVPRERT